MPAAGYAYADELALTDEWHRLILLLYPLSAECYPCTALGTQHSSSSLPTSFDGYKSKSRLNVSPSKSSSFSCANGVGVRDMSWLSSVLIGVSAKSCAGNPALMKTK